MDAITLIRSRAIVLVRDHIDTDQIIPARFLKVVERRGLGEHLFHDWRFDGDGRPRPEFVLNHARHADSAILIAGENFGCGSSREHAPWALTDWGVRAVVAPSFADIFRSNAPKSGLIPVEVSRKCHAAFVAAATAHPDMEIVIDLTAMTIRGDGVGVVRFELDSFARHCLINGLDPLGYLLEHAEAIAEFERRRGEAGHVDHL